MLSKYKHKSGILFFTYGKEYACRCLVSIYSLRKHYAGPITLALIKGDECNERLKSDLEKFDVDYKEYEYPSSMGTITYSTFKHILFEDSPYFLSILCDTDLVFTQSPERLFSYLENHDVLITPALKPSEKDVRISAKYIYSNFVMALGKHLAEQLGKKASTSEYINIGVMGLKDPKNNKLLNSLRSTIENFTAQNPYRGSAIDEYYISSVHKDYDCIKVDNIWNYIESDPIPDNVCVLHYMRDFHRGSLNKKGMIWQENLQELSEIINTTYWTQLDPVVMPGTPPRIKPLVTQSYPIRIWFQKNGILESKGLCSDTIIVKFIPKSLLDFFTQIKNNPSKAYQITKSLISYNYGLVKKHLFCI